MVSGSSGQILRVDLTKRESETESIDPYIGAFLGGRGINVKIVYDEVGQKISPYDPENRLCFGPGPLTGTPAPNSARMSVTTMCPNGLIATSGMGGFVGAEIRYAGYDNIVIQGKSDNPVYLFIHDDSVEIKDAGHIWGKDTWETQQIIKKDVGDPDVQIMCIGPGGENLVSFACIMTGLFSSAGHGGFGAIMGSKNLKAIAVRGRKGLNIAKLEEFLELSFSERRMMKESPIWQFLAQTDGSKTASGYINKGLGVIGNYEDVDHDKFGIKDYKTGAEEFWGQHYIGKIGCIGCPIYHYPVFNVPPNGIGAPKCTVWINFSYPVWNKDFNLLFRAGHLCNQFGLDHISTAGIISFLMELYNRGIITKKDTDGVAMERGGEDAIITTIHKIAKQEGFGELLKDGVLKAARTFGKDAEDCAMHIKGLEIQQYELRGYKGDALSYAVATRDTIDAFPITENMFLDWKDKTEQWAMELAGTKEAANPSSYEGKAAIVWNYENRFTLMDMLGVCQSGFTFGTSIDIPRRFFSLATGLDTGEDELFKAAQRVRTLERAFNVTRGLRKSDDTLPKRMFETPVPGGPFKGARLEKVKFEKMRDEFYELAGWDEDGVPKEETFNDLGLSSEWQTFKKRMKKEVKRNEQSHISK